jgi:GNAT superfamily N-acetyltransferase
MLDERAVAIATDYWAAHLGLSSAELFAEPLRVIPHGNAWADYDGAFALFRNRSVVASVPAPRIEALRSRLERLPSPFSPDDFARALAAISTSVVGPARIAYPRKLRPPDHPARALLATEDGAIQALREASDATQWEHGGSSIDQPCSGVFLGSQLVALAGYEIWGSTIAHIAIVTHPDFRGRGYGRSAVAHLTMRALAAGLLPHYRTLESNIASIHIAESVGFESFATSMAIRF